MTTALPTDVVVGLHGLRTFRIREDGYLLPVVRTADDHLPIPASWGSGACIARCLRTQEHQAPVDSCTCGIYSWNVLYKLRWNYAQHVDRVVAVVALEGQTIECTTGFRSQAARIVALWLNTKDLASDLRASVAVRYPGIPLFTNLEAMLSAYLPPEAAMEDPLTRYRERAAARTSPRPAPSPRPRPRPRNTPAAPTAPYEPMRSAGFRPFPVGTPLQRPKPRQARFFRHAGVRSLTRWTLPLLLLGTVLLGLPGPAAQQVGQACTALFIGCLAFFGLGGLIDVIVKRDTPHLRAQRWIRPAACAVGALGTFADVSASVSTVVIVWLGVALLVGVEYYLAVPLASPTKTRSRTASKQPSTIRFPYRIRVSVEHRRSLGLQPDDVR